jgi:hypothetical protein
MPPKKGTAKTTKSTKPPAKPAPKTSGAKKGGK